MKRKTVVIIIAATLLVALSCMVFLSSCDDSSTEVQPQDLRVMSYNIRTSTVFFNSANDKWENRRDALIQHIKSYEPDVIGMQEVTVAQRRFLITNLPEYTCISLGRDANDTGESSPVLFKTDKFELLDYSTFWLSSTPDKVSKHYKASCNRVCTYTKLKAKESGQQFTFYNTHLDHIGEEARVFSINLILEKMAEDENVHKILTGDFNATNTSECYNIATTALKDSRIVSDITMESPTFHSYSSVTAAGNSSPIDYIFLSDSVKAKEYRVLNEKVNNVYTSDHFAIYCDITLK